MKRKILGLVSIAALVIGVAVFAAPPVSSAVSINITAVDVNVGGNIWCGAVGSCTSSGAGAQVWTFPTGGVVLPQFSTTLVLTQTGGLFNFDTSDHCIGCTPTVTIKYQVGGVGPILTAAFNDTGKILAGGGNDPVNVPFNEATNWTPPFSFAHDPAGFVDLGIGYADNLHTDVCKDLPGGGPDACLPFVGATGSATSPWIGAGNGATVFFGAPVSGAIAGYTTANPSHCQGAANSCFDAGALVIHNSFNPPAVPEPSTLLLLGTGLIGLVAWGRKRLTRNP